MNQYKSFLLFTMIMVMVSSNIFAYDIAVGGILYNYNSEKTGVIVTHNLHKERNYWDDSEVEVNSSAYRGVIKIPSSIVVDGIEYPVIEIGDKAFMRSKVTSVTLPESIVSIGEYAFKLCYDLEEINFLCRITEIKKETFYACNKLQSVSIPESVIRIQDNAFESCGLSSIDLPQGLVSIGDHAFSGVPLESLTIPENVIEINSGAFASTHISSVVIPDNVKHLGSYAFYNCCYLRSVEIGDGVEMINERAFTNCPLESVSIGKGVRAIGKMAFSFYEPTGGDINLWRSPSTIVIPNNVKEIGESAFEKCKELTNLTIPENIIIGEKAFASTGIHYLLIPNGASLGRNSFDNCDRLDSITINTSYIYGFNFYNCTSLKKVVLTENVQDIGSFVFWGCTALSDIISMNPSPPELHNTTNNYDGDIFPYEVCNNAVLHVPIEGLALYANYSKSLNGGFKLYGVWGDFKTIIPISVRSFKLTYMIDDVIYKTYEVEVGAAITPEPAPTKEGYTFSGWSEIPETMPAYDVTVTGYFTKNVDVRKFESGGVTYNVNDNGTTVTVTAGYTKYKGNVTIPSTVSYNGKNYDVTSIGYVAFSDCTELTSVSLGSVMYIQNNAFYGCSGLSSITLPKSLVSIGQYAFIGCSSLTNIVSEIESPFSLEGSTFDDATFNNATLTVPAGTKSAYQSKGGWMNFKNIVEAGNGSEDVRKFESGGVTYNVNDNGTTVTVTAGYTKYKGNVTIPSTVSYNGKNYDVTSIGYVAFSDCTELTSVSLGSVMYIQNNAFYGCSGLSSITLPKSLVSIGQYAFIGCSSLTNIVSEIESPFSLEGSTFDDATFNNATLTVPAGTKSAYQAKGGWMNFKNIVEAGQGGEIDHMFLIDGIYYWILDDNSVCVTHGSMEYKGDIEIPSQVIYNGKSYTVTSIGVDAFSECRITSIMIPNSVTEIGSGAFSDCTDLTSITIPNSVTDIWDGAFQGCSGLKFIIIPNSVKVIGPGAFQNCSSLNDVYCYAEELPETLGMIFDELSVKDATLHVPAISVEAYKAAEPWNLFKEIVTIEDTGISHISSCKTVKEFYSINGERRLSPQKGFNIIKMSDGTTKKVLVK